MCQFEGKFLLCTCADDLQQEDIDWKLRRRTPNTSNLETWKLNNPSRDELSDIAGMICIPDEFKSINHEDIDDYDEYYIKMDTFSDNIKKQVDKITRLREERKEEFKNTSIHIQLALNNSTCFDTPIDFQLHDMLSIRLDKELNVWVTYTYKNTSWGISDIKISDQDHDEIVIGKVKAN